MAKCLVSNLSEGDKRVLDEILQRRQALLEDIERIKNEIKTTSDDILQVDRGKTIEKDQMRHGIKKFNNHPQAGIDFLIDMGRLERTPYCVARFLFETNSLNKTSIGIYLGDGNDFPRRVLSEFGNLHDFTDQKLDIALRKFLFSFRLPGEAQKIDRMMECFAARYCECNEGVFQNRDTCYVLSFSIIMMNTSLHNPSVKEKPTVERFIEMNRGIDGGENLPEAMLRDLFEGIKQEPFKIPPEDPVDNLFFNPDIEGWLHKQGGRYKTWRRRWFVLAGNCLYYFTLPTDKEPKGIIPLQNLEVREIVDQKKTVKNCFEIYIPTGNSQMIKAAKTTSGGKMHEGRHSTYIMSASTAQEKCDWIRHIRKCIDKVDPYYDIISRRRNASLTSPTSHQAPPQISSSDARYSTG